MKITKRQLRKIIREEAKSTKKYDDDSALKGRQDKLPDDIQKGIIDKAVDDREEDKETNESFRISKAHLKQIIKEEYTKLLLENHHQLPSLPGNPDSTSAFHFWKDLATMAKNDSDGLISLLTRKGKADQKSSRSEWESARAEMYKEMEEDGEFDEYKDEPLYLPGGIVNRKYFRNAKNTPSGRLRANKGKK